MKKLNLKCMVAFVMAILIAVIPFTVAAQSNQQDANDTSEIGRILGVDYSISDRFDLGGSMWYLNVYGQVNRSRFTIESGGWTTDSNTGDVFVALWYDGRMSLNMDVGEFHDGTRLTHLVWITPIDLPEAEIPPFIPSWLTESRFTNEDAIGDKVRSNGVFNDAISEFFEQNHEYFSLVYEATWYQNLSEARNERYPIDEQISDMFRLVLVQSWQDESLSTVMPFTQDWFEEILNGIDFYLTTDAGRGVGNHYWTSPTRSEISLTADCVWFFTHTAAHELAHALGVGEALANLFADLLLGVDYVDYLRFGGDWIFADPMFERTLLTIMENQDRGNDFWAAAFHSEAEMNRIWDE